MKSLMDRPQTISAPYGGRDFIVGEARNESQRDLEKSTIKLEKGRESALILENGLFKKMHLDAAIT